MTKEIPLTQKQFALVDDGDYDFLMQWKWFYLRAPNTGYACRRQNGRMIYMHIVLLSPPSGTEVDHKDRNGLNNTRDNIRIATPSQNRSNVTKRRQRGNRPCTSQFKGVYWHKAAKKWQAQITVSRQVIRLGMFTDETEAARAYNIAAIAYRGEFAQVNVLPE